MTDKLIMTTGLREQNLTALKEVDALLSNLNLPRHRGLEAAIAMLQSLPMVTGEPVLHIYGGEICYKSREDDQSFGMSCPATDEYLKKFKNGTRLYTSPQALAQISADDVTDEMLDAIEQSKDKRVQNAGISSRQFLD